MSEKRKDEAMPYTYVREFKPSALFGSEQKAEKNKVSVRIKKEYTNNEAVSQPPSGTLRLNQNMTSRMDQSAMSVTVFDAAFGTCLDTKASRIGFAGDTKSNLYTPLPGDDTLWI